MLQRQVTELYFLLDFCRFIFLFSRNRTMSTPEESDESESQEGSTRRLQSDPSDDKKCEEMIKSAPIPTLSNQSPKVLRRQPNLMNRPSIDGDNEENSAWHNLPKEVWKKAAEVNNSN